MEFLHDFLAKLDDRLDDMDRKMADMSQTMVKHDVNLELHMKRSDQNERAIEMLKKHVNAVNGVAAFIGFLAVLASIYAAFK